MKEEEFHKFKKQSESDLFTNVALIMIGIFFMLFIIAEDIGFLKIIYVIVTIGIPFSIISGVVNVFAKRKVKYQKLTPADFGKNKDYYRDIIKDYSPLALGYIDDFKVDDRDIIGTLLKLELEKHIEITSDNEIKRLIGSDYKLKETEKFILEEDLNRKNLKKLEYLVMKEAALGGLLKGKSFDYGKLFKKIGKILLVSAIVFIVSITIFILDYEYDIGSAFLGMFWYLLFLFSIIYPFIRIPYLVMYAWNISRNPFIRSEKGEKINIKLEGLKNYIKDFSMLDEKEVKEIKLWEDYLIYSVLFGHNKQITRNLKGKYKASEYKDSQTKTDKSEDLKQIDVFEGEE